MTPVVNVLLKIRKSESCPKVDAISSCLLLSSFFDVIKKKKKKKKEKNEFNLLK